MSRLQAGRARAVQESGQTFVEYALILAAVVVGVLLTVTWVGLTRRHAGGDGRRFRSCLSSRKARKAVSVRLARSRASKFIALSFDARSREVVMSLIHAMRAHVRDQRGQTFVEYALILAAVVVCVLLAVTWSGLGDAIQAAIDTVSGAV